MRSAKARAGEFLITLYGLSLTNTKVDCQLSAMSIVSLPAQSRLPNSRIGPLGPNGQTEVKVTHKIGAIAFNPD